MDSSKRAKGDTEKRRRDRYSDDEDRPYPSRSNRDPPHRSSRTEGFYIKGLKTSAPVVKSEPESRGGYRNRSDEHRRRDGDGDRASSRPSGGSKRDERFKDGGSRPFQAEAPLPGPPKTDWDAELQRKEEELRSRRYDFLEEEEPFEKPAKKLRSPPPPVKHEVKEEPYDESEPYDAPYRGSRNEPSKRGPDDRGPDRVRSRDKNRDDRPGRPGRDDRRLHVKEEESEERPRSPPPAKVESAEEDAGDDEEPGKVPKEAPNLEYSGKLAAETNKVAGGIVLKHVPPAESRKPNKIWRLYIFKKDELLNETYFLHRSDHFVFGRDPKVADVLTAHPSCSKQHAVLQFRLTTKNVGGRPVEDVRPYLMDLESINGTFLNGERLEAARYYELLEKDVVRFGQSSRDFVLLHDKSSGHAQD